MNAHAASLSQRGITDAGGREFPLARRRRTRNLIRSRLRRRIVAFPWKRGRSPGFQRLCHAHLGSFRPCRAIIPPAMVAILTAGVPGEQSRETPPEFPITIHMETQMSGLKFSWRRLAAVGAILLLAACAQTQTASNPPPAPPPPNATWFTV